MTIDAVSRREIDWHAINWGKVYQTVRRFQARIVKAVQGSKWRKVSFLQRLLTQSFSGKAFAVREAGVYSQINGKKRPLGIATMRDRAIGKAMRSPNRGVSETQVVGAFCGGF